MGYYPDPNAKRQEFIHCHGYGCRQKTLIGFNEAEWKKISKIFKKKSKTAEVERQKIGKAIALMERYAGEKTGTTEDLPKAPITKKSETELDCIDETINTTKYLMFLQENNFLKFHSVNNPVYKGAFLNGVYPHNSASIKEIETGNIFVIDSYIYANGEEPNIRSLESWERYRVEDLEKAHNLTQATVENLKP